MAKEKVWKVFSQPWSAWPRSWLLRGTIFMAIWCIASEDVEYANRELVEREVLDCCTRKALLEDFARRSKADSLQKTGDVGAASPC